MNNTSATLTQPKVKTTRFLLGVALAIALLSVPRLTVASTHSWTGASGDGKWSTAGNWASSSPPVAGEAASVILQFPAAGSKRSTNDISNLTIDQIQISGDNYIIAATGAGTNVTLRSQAGFSSTFFINGANAVLTNFNFTLATNFIANASVSVGSGDTATFRCRFTGPGGFIKRGTGTVVLDGNTPNTYTGLTEIQGGTVQLSQNGVAIPGDLVIGYAGLTNLAAVELLAPNQVADTADILVNYNGTFAPGVFTDTVGSITLSNADLVAGIGLTLQGDFTSIGTNLLTGTIRLGGANRIFNVTGQLTAEAFIENPTGMAGITKAGPGTMELRRPNTYNGITAVNEGVLIVSHASALGTNAVGTQVNPGATLMINGALAIAGEALFLSGTGVSSNGALCAIGGNASWTGSVSLTGEAFIGVKEASDQLTLSGVISGVSGITKVGLGRLILSGLNANTFNGVTRVWEGTLRLAKSANLRAVKGLEIGRTNTYGYCELGAANQIDDAAHVIVWHGGAFRLGGFDETIGGLMVVGSLVDTEGGLLTLLGDVEAVTWATGGFPFPTTHVPSLSGRVSLGGATRTFHLTHEPNAFGPELYLACTLVDGAGTGGIRKTGDGMMFLWGTNTYTGPTFIDQGGVGISASAALGSPVQGTTVADGAELMISGPLTVAEPLTLNGRGISGSTGALWNYNATNTWSGPITLATDSAIGIFNGTRLTLAGAISGPGKLIKTGSDTLVLAGSAPNTFTGGLSVELGMVLLNKSPGATAVRNLLQVGTTNGPLKSAAVLWLASHQVQDGAAVWIDYSGALEFSSRSDEVGSLSMRGGFIYGSSGVLTLGGNVRTEGDSFINGPLSLGGITRTFETVDGQLTLTRDVQDGGAAAGIIKTGNGRLVFDHAQTSYNGQTEVHLGNLELRGPTTLGSTAAGTVIYSGGALLLNGATVGTEPLTFDFASGAYVTPNWTCLGTNSWQGTLTLLQQVVIQPHLQQDRVTLAGAILGDGNSSFYKHGRGTLRLAGTNDNTFPGKIIATEGLLELAKTNALAITGPITVGMTNQDWPHDAVLLLLNHHQIDDTNRVTVLNNGVFDLNGFTELVGGLDLTHAEVRTGAGQLRLGGGVNVSDVSNIEGRLSLGDESRVFDLEENAVLVVQAAVSALDPGAGMTLNGSGTVYLYGTNTFGGETRIINSDVHAQTRFAFGSTASGIVVSNYGRVYLAKNIAITNEPLHLVQGQLLGAYQSTNAWQGPITVGDYSVIDIVGTNSLFLLGGAISGNGGLTLFGNFILHGSQPNTFTGELWTREGLVQLSKTNAIAVPGELTVGFFNDEEVSTVRLLRPNQIADGSAVNVARQYSQMSGAFGAPFVLDLNGISETIGSLQGNGNVVLGAGTVTVGANNASTEFKGRITGNAQTNLIKTGSGALTLSGTNNYPGLTRVTGGTLLVNGSIAPSAVQIDASGSLGGNGVTGDISCYGGRIIPGPATVNPSFGRLKAGTVSFNTGSTFRCELGQALPATECDQIELDGFLNIANSILSVQSFGTGAVSNQYTIIKVAGGASPFGSFAGLPEGTIFMPTPGRSYQITYHGGSSGRDVVLTQLSAPQPAQMTGITPAGEGKIQLSGTGTPGLGYDVYAATNLVGATWISIGSITAGGDGLLQFIDTDAPNFPMRFYRFVLP